MTGLRTLAVAAAALSLAGQSRGWTVSLPPCLSPFQPYIYSGCYTDLSNPDTLSFRSTLERSNMTIEACVADCKGNGYRYAGVEYYGECYCGATVNAPQVDDGECSFACTGNKSQVCGGNDRISIYQDPTYLPSDGVDVEDYTNIGCHTDDSDLGKALAYPVQDVTGQAWDRQTGTNSKCLQACKSKGFPFAGTEYGGECWCGVVVGNGTDVAPQAECDMPCLGNTTENCGGRSRINIWVAKDLQSLEPCGYQPPSSPSSSTTAPPTSTTVTTESSTQTSSTTSINSRTTSLSTTSSSATLPESSCTSSVLTTLTLTTTPSKTSITVSSSTTTTSSCTPTTTKPPTLTSSTSAVRTTTSSAACVTTIVTTPKCEYKCGNWCSEELPDWDEQKGCQSSYSKCKLQIAACFKQAGWPGSMDCFQFANWCSDCDAYCKKSTKSKCSKSDWFKQKPPSQGTAKPTTSTITVPCAPQTTSKPATTSAPAKPTTTSKAATTTTKCPVPTVTNICKQPSNVWKGYGADKPVGGIELPVVTCNDLKAEFQSGKQWKLYTDSDSTKCKSYPHSGVPGACKDACKEQYDDCLSVYAEGCKKGSGGFGWPWKRSLAGRTFVWSDNWQTASDKCLSQYKDCLAVNAFASANGKCYSWGSGW